MKLHVIATEWTSHNNNEIVSGNQQIFMSYLQYRILIYAIMSGHQEMLSRNRRASRTNEIAF